MRLFSYVLFYPPPPLLLSSPLHLFSANSHPPPLSFPYVLPSFLTFFLPSFLPSFRPSFLPSFLPSSFPSSLLSLPFPSPFLFPLSLPGASGLGRGELQEGGHSPEDVRPVPPCFHRISLGRVRAVGSPHVARLRQSGGKEAGNHGPHGAAGEEPFADEAGEGDSGDGAMED